MSRQGAGGPCGDDVTAEFLTRTPYYRVIPVQLIAAPSKGHNLHCDPVDDWNIRSSFGGDSA